MIRKQAWFGLSALALVSALVTACGGDDSNGSGSGTGGVDGTGATGPATGAASGTGGGDGTGATASTGATGNGTGGVVINPIPPGTEDYDCTPATGTAPALTLTPIVSGLERPVFLAAAPGDDDRLFVLEQEGLLKIIVNGAALPTPFLDLTDDVYRGDVGEYEYDERGLLGLAFHPRFAETKLVYIYHTRGTGAQDDPMQNVIAEYKVSDADANVLDANSRRDVLVIDDFAPNHNGGTIGFGGDGFLYFASGDGGGGGDPEGNGQNVATLLGKVLRIDVDKRDAGQYGIPPGNLKEELPSAAPEVWDYGLRNPYRWSFDGCTGDIYIGEVGQDTTEEINIEPPLTGHRNYGWADSEGDCSGDCTGPVTTRPTQVAAAIQGGYVYRGSNIPALRGTYFYGEYATGDIYSLVWDGTTANNVQKTSLSVSGALMSFGQDNQGEVYVLGNSGGDDTGVVYRIDAQ
jgi:glucose/arabinose dehydrogenase